MTLSAIAENGRVSRALIAPCVGPSARAPAPATETVDGGPGATLTEGQKRGRIPLPGLLTRGVEI